MTVFINSIKGSAFWHEHPPNGAFNVVSKCHRWSAVLLSSLDRQELGRLGENITAKWATRNGFQITAQQARHIGFELDLVTHKNTELRIIEVKTRLDPKCKPDSYTTAAWLNKKKRISLKRGAEFVLQKLGSTAQNLNSITFDLIVVDIFRKSNLVTVYRWPDVLA